MKFYESTVQIHATPDTVWAILTDIAHYPDWDSGVVRVEGQLALGNSIKVVSAVNPDRAFPVRVAELTSPRRMVWTGGMPLGLFKGVRTFTLTPESDASTRFHMREEYTGPLLSMIFPSMPDLQPSFDQFASGIKKAAESRT